MLKEQQQKTKLYIFGEEEIEISLPGTGGETKQRLYGTYFISIF
jgi:hypothetical protein